MYRHLPKIPVHELSVKHQKLTQKAVIKKSFLKISLSDIVKFFKWNVNIIIEISESNIETFFGEIPTNCIVLFFL